MPVDKFGRRGGADYGVPGGSLLSPVGLVHRAGDTMLGALSMGGFPLKTLAMPLDSINTATKEYVDTRDVLPASGGSMSGALNMGGNEIVGLADPTAAQSAAPKKYIDSVVSTALTKVLQLDGSKAPTHDIWWSNHKITELADPKSPQDAATKSYVDKKRYIKHLIDRFILSAEWDPTMSASLESVGGLHLSTLWPESGGLSIKKPGVYAIMLVGSHTGHPGGSAK